MKVIHFLVAIVFLAAPFLTIGDVYGNENATPFFDIGNFTVTEDWEIKGTYMSSGLEGCNISVYSEDERHIMDIVYKSHCVDVYLKVFDDSLLKTMLERGVIERGDLVKISFSGPQITFTYDNCGVELHDATIRFLRIKSLGKIVFSNLTGYNITKTSYNVATLQKGDCCGAIICNKDLTTIDGKIIAYGEAMFRGITLQTNNNIEEILTVEDAIKYGDLGGEITIVKEGNEFDWISTCYYNNVTVELIASTLTERKAELIVNGDEQTTGKTIKINIGEGVLSPQDLRVKFDGKELSMADNITDVLNPNDDGLQPEYVIVEIAAGKGEEFFILVSVPHFSEHIITLQSLSKNPLFLGVAIVSAFLVLAVASWVLFKK